MKKLYIAIAFLFTGIFSYSQDYDPMVDTLMNKIEIDSLVNYVRILSGEDSVFIDGTKTIIEDRIQSSNDLAAAYILQTLNTYNSDAFYHDYSTGRNILAIQEGSVYPDQYVMICAHYDAVTPYCADDNASGTAGVLEAARIFSEYDFQYSIIYALWDQEEIGLIGSNAYAEEAAANGDDIMWVINMDMIAYDSNNDDLCEIHAKNYAQTLDLANFVKGMNTVYEVGLAPEIEFPGTSASDHASFWGSSYSAILLIEAYYGGDFNPYYHSVQDRINICNLPYFHKMAKLAIGSLAALAMPDINISVEEYFASSQSLEIYNYPNPFNNETTISYKLHKASNVSIHVVNSVGQIVADLTNEREMEGIHTVNFSKGDLETGIYFVTIRTDEEISTSKMVIE
jgi:hypothetical protein